MDRRVCMRCVISSASREEIAVDNITLSQTGMLASEKEAGGADCHTVTRS